MRRQQLLLLLPGVCVANYKPEERAAILNWTLSLPPLPAVGEALDGLAGVNTPISRCRIHMIMTDNRRLHPSSAREYWVKTAVVNRLIAQRYNYTFTYALVEQPHENTHGNGKFGAEWCKLPVLQTAAEHALRRSEADGSCTWLFSIDSDAFVRDSGVDLARRIAGLAEAKQAEVVLSREDGGDELLSRSLQGGDRAEFFGFPEAGTIFNTGVLFVRASAFSVRFLRRWFEQMNELPDCAELRDKPMREQSCLVYYLERMRFEETKRLMGETSKSSILRYHCPAHLRHSFAHPCRAIVLLRAAC
jgi:hypothetical protein